MEEPRVDNGGAEDEAGRLVIRNRDRRPALEEYARLPRLPITVVLDGLRSSFNVGAIFRSCECARIEELITCGITAHPPDEQVLRTSMGTWEYVPHRHLETVEAAVALARQRGARVVALETTSRSKSIYEMEFPRPLCLLLGNEALGLDEQALALADELVEIPLLGYKNSLNVSVAGGIALFEVLRSWGELQPAGGLEPYPG